MYQNQGATATTQPIVLANMPPMPIYLPYPQPYNCPNCKNQIVTRTEAETGSGTWIIAGFLCLMGCWCGCQLIPFFVDRFKDVKHFCPNCNHYLGIKKVM